MFIGAVAVHYIKTLHTGKFLNEFCKSNLGFKKKWHIPHFSVSLYKSMSVVSLIPLFALTQGEESM